MQLDWNDHQQELFDRYLQFGRTEIAPRAMELAAANQFDAAGWQELSQMGFFQEVIPGEYGGLGVDWWNFTAALEGLATGCGDGGFLLTAISQAGFIRGLLASGSAAQKAKYLPLVLDGGLTATAIAESQTGSDLSSLETSAVAAEGQGWLLNGYKWNIAHAPTATASLVVGRMPELGKRDITLFLVDHDLPGVTTGLPDEKLGNRTLPTGWLKFADTPLSEEHILGSPGSGPKALSPIVLLQRIYYGWMTSRLLQPVLDDALSFLEKRQSFKRPLLEHQYVQGKLTEVLLGMSQSRWVGLGAMHQLLSGAPDAALQSSVAKLTGVRACFRGAHDLLTLLGSNGYQNSRASHLMQDAIGFGTVGGTEEMHRINIFNQFMRNR